MVQQQHLVWQFPYRLPRPPVLHSPPQSSSPARHFAAAVSCMVQILHVTDVARPLTRSRHYGPRDQSPNWWLRLLAHLKLTAEHAISVTCQYEMSWKKAAQSSISHSQAVLHLIVIVMPFHIYSLKLCPGRELPCPVSTGIWLD